MKIIYIAAFISILILSGCTSPSEITAQSKKLVEIGGEASCIEYEIQDSKGESIEVPDEIQQSLECLTGAVKLSPDSGFLLYDADFDLKIYDFEHDRAEILMVLDDSIEGISCIWHDSGSKIACALVNQQEYEGSTKIFAFKIENGKLINRREFTQTHDTMLDFVCGASCYPGDFWFEDENTLKYNGHNIIAPGEIFEISL